MGSERNKKKIILDDITHRDVLEAALEKYNGYNKRTCLEKYLELQINIYRSSGNSEFVKKRIRIVNDLLEIVTIRQDIICQVIDFGKTKIKAQNNWSNN